MTVSLNSKLYLYALPPRPVSFASKTCVDVFNSSLLRNSLLLELMYRPSSFWSLAIFAG